VKIVYLLAVLMLLGVFLIFVCSMKVLNELNSASTSPRFSRRPAHRSVQDPTAKTKRQMYVIGTYIGLTFFVVGGAGSILALFQAMRRF
jgi:ABC-type glycerol-3-phosphate transport system permease component